MAEIVHDQQREAADDAAVLLGDIERVVGIAGEAREVAVLHFDDELVGDLGRVTGLLGGCADLIVGEAGTATEGAPLRLRSSLTAGQANPPGPVPPTSG